MMIDGRTPTEPMVPERLLSETERRYETRSMSRTARLAKVRSGAILDADSSDRVAKRLERLTHAGPVTESITDIALERVLGKNDLVSVSYLDLALRVSRTVARVVVRSAAGQTLMHGSGFLVSPELLLTNNHVLEDRDAAAFSRVEFNFQDGIDGRPLPSMVFDLEPSRFFVTDQALDYTLVAVSSRSRDAGAPLSFGWNRLIEEQGKVIIGEFLNIIQHPNGERKQLALRENQLVDVLDDFLHYHTDTAPGSSGSPVFNDQWEVVALHHSGVPRRNAQGQILARNGSIWTPDMGEQQIDWMANEGVRISQIVRHVKAQQLSPEQTHLRDEMFTAPLTTEQGGSGFQQPSRKPALTGASSAGAGPVVGADGQAVWTLPIQISVRIGQQTVSNPTAAPAAPGATPVQPPAYQQPGRRPSTNGAGSTNGSSARIRDSAELQEALEQYEAARRRPYYDEAADAAARDKYYARLDQSLGKDELFRRLHDLLDTTHKSPRPYKPSVHVYPDVDLHPDWSLHSIYSGEVMDTADAIRADFAIEAQRERFRELLLTESSRDRPLLAAEIDQLEARMPFNCEHVVPQSYFAKREPMRGDLHHLFACESDCNSFRSNIPYFDFPNFMEVERTKCGKRVGNRFEPEAGKGAVARATLYFLLRYPGEVNRTDQEYREDRLKVLLSWHQAHPVTTYERRRNAVIQRKQGNRNPLIDFPELADGINFALGLG